MYPHIIAKTPVWDVIRHPAFQGRGKLLFPWDEDHRYPKNMTMAQAPSLLLWHTNMDVGEMIQGVNRLIDDINDGKQVLYDFYSTEDKCADPSKKNTGLFFLRGMPGAPFAVVSAGGGFYYVGSLHGGFPPAIELNRHGYNVFVLKYRVGQGETISSRDLIAAVHFILAHANELEVNSKGYSLWGGSAGARLSSNASYGEGGIHRSEIIHPAAVVMAYTTFAGKPAFSSDDPAAYMIAGTRDWIVPSDHMPARAAIMRNAGIPVECRILPGVEHGFGTGKGMQAEGWMKQAIAFWEQHKSSGETTSQKGDLYGR